MKRYITLLLSFLFVIAAAEAQNSSQTDKKKMMEDLEKFKIDFITKEMNLSEKEKAEFIPIYKEYSQERRKAGAEAWKLERELQKKKDASPEDYKRLADLQRKAREKDNTITTQYDAKFEKILNAKQIYLMHKAEEKFFDKMKEMRKKHGDKSQKEAGKGHKRAERQKAKGKPCAEAPLPECALL
ncbi:MAG: hypothetical protein K2K93_00950 [Muribaculaceae bacterium]|nr:hypothetical protein [Muribaculaceae bacterium]